MFRTVRRDAHLRQHRHVLLPGHDRLALEVVPVLDAPGQRDRRQLRRGRARVQRHREHDAEAPREEDDLGGEAHAERRLLHAREVQDGLAHVVVQVLQLLGLRERHAEHAARRALVFLVVALLVAALAVLVVLLVALVAALVAVILAALAGAFGALAAAASAPGARGAVAGAALLHLGSVAAVFGLGVLLARHLGDRLVDLVDGLVADPQDAADHDRTAEQHRPQCGREGGKWQEEVVGRELPVLGEDEELRCKGGVCVGRG